MNIAACVPRLVYFLFFVFFFFCLVWPFHSIPNLLDVPTLSDLDSVEVTNTTISMRWIPLNYTAITGYRVTVVAAGESIPVFQEVVEPTAGHYTVYGLEPGVHYDISVVAITEAGEGKPATHTQQTGEFALSAFRWETEFESWGGGGSRRAKGFKVQKWFRVVQSAEEVQSRKGVLR